MLSLYYPTSDAGAAHYGGFLYNGFIFCKIFVLKDSFDELIFEVNTFLESAGYDKIPQNEIATDNKDSYSNDLINFSQNTYVEREYLLFIRRRSETKSQTEFLIKELVKFRDDRDWAQFHNAKDLAIALNIESSELLENFLWKNPADANIDKIKEELADVFAYALLLAEKYEFNIEEIVLEKIRLNALKYPVDKAKGSAKKYDEL